MPQHVMVWSQEGQIYLWVGVQIWYILPKLFWMLLTVMTVTRLFFANSNLISGMGKSWYPLGVAWWEWPIHLQIRRPSISTHSHVEWVQFDDPCPCPLESSDFLWVFPNGVPQILGFPIIHDQFKCRCSSILVVSHLIWKEQELPLTKQSWLPKSSCFWLIVHTNYSKHQFEMIWESQNLREPPSGRPWNVQISSGSRESCAAKLNLVEWRNSMAALPSFQQTKRNEQCSKPSVIPSYSISSWLVWNRIGSS